MTKRTTICLNKETLEYLKSFKHKLQFTSYDEIIVNLIGLATNLHYTRPQILSLSEAPQVQTAKSFTELYGKLNREGFVKEEDWLGKK